MTGQCDHPHPGAQTEQGGGDWQTHGAERPEADEQDEDRREDPDDRREPQRRLLRLLDRLTSELDIERRRLRRPGGRDHPVNRRLGQCVGPLIEVDGRERNRSVARDCVSAGRVGTDDCAHVLQTRDSRQHLVNRSTICRVRQLAAARVEDDLVRVPRLRGEAGLEQVDRLLGACPGQCEAAGGLLSDRARDGEDPDGSDDPTNDGDPAMRHCPASDSQHRFAPTFTMGKIATGAFINRVQPFVNT